jgi:hypothetical protein
MAAKHENRSIDVPTMQKMSAKEYREFLREEELLYLDIEGILRLSPDGNPVASSKQQLDILIEELRQCREQMKGKAV